MHLTFEHWVSAILVKSEGYESRVHWPSDFCLFTLNDKVAAKKCRCHIKTAATLCGHCYIKLLLVSKSFLRAQVATYLQQPTSANRRLESNFVLKDFIINRDIAL